MFNYDEDSARSYRLAGEEKLEQHMNCLTRPRESDGHDTIKEYILGISIGAYDKVNSWGKKRRAVSVNIRGYVDEN